MNPVDNILDNKKVPCFKCRKLHPRNEMHYWYHGDQDDLICKNCALKTKHIDTGLRGMKVLK